MSDKALIELQLVACYRQQAQLYSVAEQTTEEILYRIEGGLETGEQLKMLEATIIQARQLDSETVKLHAGIDTNAGACQDLRESVADVRESLVTLMNRIAAAEAATAKARERLVPEVDAHTRRHQMYKAYAT